jgi:hypothetical protein
MLNESHGFRIEDEGRDDSKQKITGQYVVREGERSGSSCVMKYVWISYHTRECNKLVRLVYLAQHKSPAVDFCKLSLNTWEVAMRTGFICSRLGSMAAFYRR